MKSVNALLLAAALAVGSFAAAAAPVNINTADAKSLETALVGVGPKAAKAIVDYRTKNGAFKSVEDLEKVKGIGPKLVEKNRSNLTVQ
jgi:competence protein ComEA